MQHFRSAGGTAGAGMRGRDPLPRTAAPCCAAGPASAGPVSGTQNQPGDCVQSGNRDRDPVPQRTEAVAMHQQALRDWLALSRLPCGFRDEGDAEPF